MADNFDDNPIVAHLRKIYYGAEDATPNALWGFFKEQFAKQPAAGRHCDLIAIDSYLAEHGTSPTRETADLISKKRELSDLHSVLSRAGR
jgi:hypothetical protein